MIIDMIKAFIINMEKNKKFDDVGKDFWANVRLISQEVGYTVRGSKKIKIPSLTEIQKSLEKKNLKSHHIAASGKLTEFGEKLIDYFEYRADVLNNHVESQLMDADKARNTFEKLKQKHNPSCPIPMNKQKGNKKAPAFLTAIVNILLEAHSDNICCNYDPRELTIVTKDNKPLRTFARRVDGCFPSVVNPLALWEIKEYYYTTTFGSRVADGVYETLLDGMEIEELSEKEHIDIMHLLIIDSHYTWWECGRSYLCRIIDMLNMGYVDEVLFGYEVVEKFPQIVQSWVRKYRKISSS